MAVTSGAALALGGVLAARPPRTARAAKPKLKPAYTCPPLNEGTGGFGGRVAQSFTATRSGTLRQVTIGILKPDDDPGGDYLVQVVRMAGTVPSNNAIDVIAAVSSPFPRARRASGRWLPISAPLN